MKKVKLVAKTPLKMKRLNLRKPTIYFSGFCATDNANFALFDVPMQFLVDRGFNNVLNFKLSEDDLWMLIDRNHEIKPLIEDSKIVFDSYGTIDKKHFDLLFSLNSQCRFFPVTEWFGKASNRLIVGLPNRDGKPIGILKTVT